LVFPQPVQPAEKRVHFFDRNALSLQAEMPQAEARATGLSAVFSWKKTF
jgi:hypothetical protein